MKKTLSEKVHVIFNNDLTRFESGNLHNFVLHEEKMEPVLKQILERHMLEQVREVSNTRIATQHARIHCKEHSFYEECDYLAKWQVKSESLAPVGPYKGLGHTPHYRWAKIDFDGLKVRLRLDERSERFQDLKASFPEDFDAGLSEQAPYDCPKSEIPLFEELEISFSEIFDQLYWDENMFMLEFVT